MEDGLDLTQGWKQVMTRETKIGLLLGMCVILLIGISNFGREGIENSKRANKFMRWRIIAQAVAVALILLFVFIRRQGGQ